MFLEKKSVTKTGPDLPPHVKASLTIFDNIEGDLSFYLYLYNLLLTTSKIFNTFLITYVWSVDEWSIWMSHKLIIFFAFMLWDILPCAPIF